MTKIVDISEFRAQAQAGPAPKTAVRFAPAVQQVEANGSERVATFVFSDNSVDRYGDTIDARGWVLESFNANPVALFGHDSGAVENVIGRARNVRVQGERLIGEIEFMEASINPTAEAVFQMVKGGFLNAVSVGFQPIDWALSKDKARPGGIDFKKQELLEISIVPIPANANALAQARAAGIDVDRLKLIDGAKSPKISTRGLYEVSFLAQLLAELSYLEDMVEWEAEIEGDNSAIPQRLTDALKALGQVLVDMTVEEVSELVSEDDAGEVPILVDDPTIMGVTAGQRALVFLVRLARLGAASSLAFSLQKFKATDVARLFTVSDMPSSKVDRAGKVLSAANQKMVSDALDCHTKGCEIMKGMLDAVTGDEPTADEAAKSTAGRRRREAEALRLRVIP